MHNCHCLATTNSLETRSPSWRELIVQVQFPPLFGFVPVTMVTHQFHQWKCISFCIFKTSNFVTHVTAVLVMATGQPANSTD
jgi:hypothetical protein